MRADRKGGTKPTTAVFLRGDRGAFQAELVALETSCAPFPFPFQALRGGEKLFGRIVAVQKIRPTRFGKQSELFALAFFVLGGVGDIRVIIEYGDGKFVFERFETARRARPAAAVQKEPVSLPRFRHELFHFLIEIGLVHAAIVPQTRQKYKGERLFGKILYGCPARGKPRAGRSYYFPLSP